MILQLFYSYLCYALKLLYSAIHPIVNPFTVVKGYNMKVLSTSLFNSTSIHFTFTPQVLYFIPTWS